MKPVIMKTEFEVSDEYAKERYQQDKKISIIHLFKGSRLNICIMSNDLKIKIPKDFDKIDPNELGELIWWSAHLGVTPEKILSAINKTGNIVTSVRNCLKLTSRGKYC